MNTDYIFFKVNTKSKSGNFFSFYKVCNNEAISVSPIRGIRKIKTLPQMYLSELYVIDENEYEQNKKRILNQLGV